MKGYGALETYSAKWIYLLSKESLAKPSSVSLSRTITEKPSWIVQKAYCKASNAHSKWLHEALQVIPYPRNQLKGRKEHLES